MSENIQKKLLRVRPPKVKITYDVETGGALEKKELPFIVGILADLKGERDPAVGYPPLKERSMVEIDRDNFNDVMAAIAPCANLIRAKESDAALRDLLTASADNELIFSSIDDFDPLKVIQALPSLNSLYTSRRQIRELQAKAEASDSVERRLDAIIDTLTSGTTTDDALLEDWSGAVAADSNIPAQRSALLVSSFLSRLSLYFVAPQAISGNEPAANKAMEDARRDGANKIAIARAHGSVAVIDELVAQIDRELSAALSSIMHSDSFKAMEATWRGLQYLVMHTETSAMLKLHVFNATKDELLKDMMKAVEFDQSALFKLIYDAEYGTFGGNPYSLLIGDYIVGNSADDIDFITRIAKIAAAAHAPFLTQASEELFHLSGSQNADEPHDLRKRVESADLIGWQAFRQQEEDARYVSLVLPRALLRLPYGTAGAAANRNTMPCAGIDFEEHVGGDGAVTHTDNNCAPIRYPDPEPGCFLWGNPAYLLGQRITNAFALYGWTAAIYGIEHGGLVEGLPCYTYASNSGSIELFCPIEIPITDHRAKELNDLGFVALCHRKGTGQAVFFGGRATNRPKKYLSESADASIPAMLPCILTASRFAHYIKVIMRNKIGSFLTRGNTEDFLNSWIADYVLLDDNASQEVKAAYPLREARVAVTEVPGAPGAYRATLFLKPHFQLEALATSIRLVINLPQ